MDAGKRAHTMLGSSNDIPQFNVQETQLHGIQCLDQTPEWTYIKNLPRVNLYNSLAYFQAIDMLLANILSDHFSLLLSSRHMLSWQHVFHSVVEAGMAQA